MDQSRLLGLVFNGDDRAITGYGYGSADSADPSAVDRVARIARRTAGRLARRVNDSVGRRRRRRAEAAAEE
jgi:hypothetical protein